MRYANAAIPAGFAWSSPFVRWSPKYFPAELVKAAAGMLSGKVLFGSDYPLITPERWLDDFADLELRAEVLPGIFKGNACKILGLA